ncbi:MAG TPA: DUF5686 family protein, partial [Ferruginibacter sp.]|nr:DUF5686 family protein [Ferruginibacter sp.]
MNLCRFIIATLFLIIIPTVATAQSVTITGIIRDAHTQEPINFASVYLQESGIGKTTDSIGFFSIKLNHLTADTLIVSYVGYQVFKLQVSPLTDTGILDIPLIRGGENTAVVVKASVNKGLFLWRKVMSKKQQYNRYNLPNFGYEAYNKLEIDIKNFNAGRVKNNILLKPFSFIINPLAAIAETEGFLPAYLIESVSDYSYQRNPKKYYENIKASNTRGFINESMGRMMGVMQQNVNVYSNFINVMDKNFISPFHDNADNYYSFAVPDTQLLNGQKIF